MGNENAFWSGHFRTAKAKTQAVKFDFEKQLLRLAREERTLRKNKQELGYEPLIPPVQKGFKRFFVLRDDVAKSPRAEFFQAILDKINTVQYSDTRHYTKTKRFRGRKTKEPRDQHLRMIFQQEWLKLHFTPEEAFYFVETLEFTPQREWRKVFRFVEPWRFRLKVTPNLITQVRIRDADLEKRLKEINNYLERNFLRLKMWKLMDGNAGYAHFEEGLKNANPLKNKPLHWVMEEVIQDSVPDKIY